MRYHSIPVGAPDPASHTSPIVEDGEAAAVEPDLPGDRYAFNGVAYRVGECCLEGASGAGTIAALSMRACRGMPRDQALRSGPGAAWRDGRCEGAAHEPAARPRRKHAHKWRDSLRSGNSRAARSAKRPSEGDAPAVIGNGQA